MEESDHAICQLRSAGYEGEQVLLLPVRLYFMLEENNEYRHLILTLAVSTAAWVAQRKGEIREPGLVVNGIGMFANQSSRQVDLYRFHRISLRVRRASDACLEFERS